ncbi:MAG: molybdopterin converting factor subunit 1 [Gammaproteobacteria bacterium]|nr:molybdopterin converting factor subunit 1 [Gammaproteobacteria bacterium]MBT8436607.1 molybdopterin converting factor subunit 1 [Gammaproteobacteria bacterium]
MAEVLYFARLAEELGMKSEQIDLSARCQTVADLVEILRSRGEPFDSTFDGKTQVLVAINQEMSEPSATISNIDEIAFFPPVTGG